MKMIAIPTLVKMAAVASMQWAAMNVSVKTAIRVITAKLVCIGLTWVTILSMA